MRKLFYFTIAIAFGIAIGFWVHPLISQDNIYTQIKKFEQVLNTAYKNYVEES